MALSSRDGNYIHAKEKKLYQNTPKDGIDGAIQGQYKFV
jgi:hypothetical protein